MYQGTIAVDSWCASCECIFTIPSW